MREEEPGTDEGSHGRGEVTPGKDRSKRVRVWKGGFLVNTSRTGHVLQRPELPLVRLGLPPPLEDVTPESDVEATGR